MKSLFTMLALTILAGAALALPPEAEFVASPHAGTAPLDVEFTDYSVGTPAVTGWDWDFGDGTTFSGQTPPTHTYADPGMYTVSLTVTNGDGSDTRTKTNYIVVGVSPPPDGWNGDNTIGVYSNPTYPDGVELSNSFEYTVGSPIAMHWVLTNCTQETIGGFEFAWRFNPDPVGSYFVLGVTLPPGALNIGNNFNLIVGIGIPYPTQPQMHTVLATFNVLFLAPGILADVQIGPAVPASIPGHVVFNDGEDPALLFPAAYSTVDLDHAVINEEGYVVTPVGTVGGQGPVATEARTLSEIKAIFR